MSAERADIMPADQADFESLDHLLDRVAHGDEAAFAAVYRQVAAAVYGLAHTMTADAGWSEEVTTEVLAEIWRTASQYTPSKAGSAQSWIMTIARQHAVSHVRAARGAKKQQRPTQLNRRKAGLPGSETLGRSAPVRGPGQQMVELALYGGYTTDEIGELLGIAPAAVAGFIRDGLRQVASLA